MSEYDSQRIVRFKCPNCNNVYSKTQYQHGRVFGSNYYSDGKIIKRGLYSTPIIAKCTKCHTIYWLDESNEYIYVKGDIFESYSEYYTTIEISPGRYTREYTDKYRALKNKPIPEPFLTIDDYFKALKTGIVKNTEQAIYIRKNILWAFNDKIRPLPKFPGSDQYEEKKQYSYNKRNEIRRIKNIKELIKLFEQSNIENKLILDEILDKQNYKYSGAVKTINKQKIMLAELNRNLGEFDNCINILQTIDENTYWIKDQIIKECKNSNKWLIPLIIPDDPLCYRSID